MGELNDREIGFSGFWRSYELVSAVRCAVRNFHVKSFTVEPPSAVLVPFGTVTVYSVAAAQPFFGMNSNPVVPSQLYFPSIGGLIVRYGGTSSDPVRRRIGWSNRTVRNCDCSISLPSVGAATD